MTRIFPPHVRISFSITVAIDKGCYLSSEMHTFGSNNLSDRRLRYDHLLNYWSHSVLQVLIEVTLGIERKFWRQLELGYGTGSRKKDTYAKDVLFSAIIWKTSLGRCCPIHGS